VRHVERMRGNEKCIKVVVGGREEKLTLEGDGLVWRYSPGINIDTTEIAMISGSLSPRHGASSGCGWRNGL